MQTQSRTRPIARLLTNLQSASVNSTASSLLITHFEGIIKNYASRFPNAWREDFVQEGRIALIRAAQKFPLQNNADQFEFYARRAIRNGMLNFSKTMISRAPDCIETIYLGNEEAEHIDKMEDLTLDAAFEEHTLLEVDLRNIFSDKELIRAGFNSKEIQMIDLRFKQGYRITEIAEMFQISVAQASKIITKIRLKLISLLQKKQIISVN